MNQIRLLKVRVSAALILLFVATPSLAMPKGQTSIATEQLGGTILSLTPQIAWERAVLRVSGPGDYALTKRFPPSSTISVDLSTEAESIEGATLSVPRALLPDGRYRYEVVFTTALGESKTHTGQFFVEGGAALGRGAKQTALREIREELASRTSVLSLERGQAQVGGEGTFADDFVAIQDTASDGITSLYLLSESLNAVDWVLTNAASDARFRQQGGVGAGYRMVIEDGGQVGIGTTSPLQELHIYSPDGADIRLSGSGGDWVWGIDSATAALAAYDATTSSSVFRLAQGAPGDSLVIHADGRVSIGTVSQAADLDVQGDVRGTTFASASSRELKAGFEAVDPATILARLSELPVTAWRYKDDEAGTTHIGPVAEDFQRLFGLGDGQTISNVDAVGVLMASVQGLQREVDSRDETIARLSARLAALEARVSAETRPPFVGLPEQARSPKSLVPPSTSGR